MKANRFVVAAAVFFMILSLQSLGAQTFVCQNQAEDRTKFGLRFLRPNFEGEDGLSTFSGTYDFYANAPVSARLNLVASVPFHTFSAEGNEGESGVGNVYVGLQARTSSSDDGSTSVS